MSKIFISHSSEDNAKALAVADWLRQNGWVRPFLDITPSDGLSPGERWKDALRTAADRCEAVVCLISPNWCNSTWCLEEFRWAKQLGKTIFGVIVGPTPNASIPQDMRDEWQLCDLVTGQEQQHFHIALDPIVSPTYVSLAGAGLVKLKRGLQKAGLDPSIFSWPPPHDPARLPYRGLKALEADDAAVFFGREAALIQALDLLHRMEVDEEQFFVILGASGAGKSSFLRAGLWPRLKRDDRHFLPLPVMRPERAAITGQTGLVECLARTFREYKTPKTRASLRDALANPEGLVELIAEIQTVAQKKLGPEAAPPTIVFSLDQAEELFGKQRGEEAGHLLDLLGKLIRHPLQPEQPTMYPASRVIVLAAIRSDSYERLQTAPALSGIKQRPFNLPPLAPAEYKMVIEGPALRATDAGRKLTIEAALTTQLLQDAEGADALPLLAFILERLLIAYGDDGKLLLTEYEALGGLQGSIEAAVNEAWRNPDQDPVIPADEAARRVLLQRAFPYLVVLDHEAERPKRRVATWSRMPPETHPLLERLVAARLLVKDRRKREDSQEDVVVEVAHEALIRHWALLKSWVDANREFLAWQQRLNSTKKRWEESGKLAGLLLRGLPLREAEKWMNKQHESFLPDERAFVLASQNRRTRERLATTMSIVLVLWLIGGTTWLWQKGYNVEQAILKIQSIFISIHVPPQMVPIPGGTFQMGDVDLEEAAWGIPVHLVRIKPFQLGKHEVSFEEYDRFAIAEGRPLPNDQGWGRHHRPVIYVSWEEATAYAEWLSQKMDVHYRLPTEAEWEYAARSGTKQELWAGTSEKSHLRNYTVFNSNSDKHTSVVGEKEPNGFQLHDMSGNVWEWIEDCWHANYSGAPEDGTAWQEARSGDCGQHVLRGGSWLNPSGALRTSNRFRATSPNRNNDIGFRLAQDIAP